MLRLVIIAASFVVLSWVVMIVLARRLPPGLAKDLATVLPACVTTARRLRRDSRVPKMVKVAVASAGLWVLSPIDLIPEFLPVIGPLDDIVVVALALRFAARRIPPEALIDAWPAEPESWTGLCRSRGPPPRPTERIDGCNHCEAQSRGPHPGSYWRAARVRGRSTGSALATTSDAGGVLAGVSMKVRRDPGWSCCSAWVVYLRSNGATVDVTDDSSQSAPTLSGWRCRACQWTLREWAARQRVGIPHAEAGARRWSDIASARRLYLVARAPT